MTAPPAVSCGGCRHRDTVIAELRAELTATRASRDSYRDATTAVRDGLAAQAQELHRLVPYALTIAERAQPTPATLSALILGLVYTTAAPIRASIGMPS